MIPDACIVNQCADPREHQADVPTATPRHDGSPRGCCHWPGAFVASTVPPPPLAPHHTPGYAQPFVPGSGDAAAPAASRPAAAPATKSTSNFYGGSSSAGAVAPPAASNVNIVPLMALNTYLNRFTIKVRVTAKSDIRTWNKPTSSGKLFSVDLLDENVRVCGCGCVHTRNQQPFLTAAAFGRYRAQRSVAPSSTTRWTSTTT